jgi:hypothetical protein
MYRTDPSFPLTVKVEKLLSTDFFLLKTDCLFHLLYQPTYTMGPAQWGPAFVGLWATRRRSKDVPAAFCCDKDSDSSPLARVHSTSPPPIHRPMVQILWIE